MVKISQLELENVKKIKTVQLTPTETGLTIIGGRNNQGKSSVLATLFHWSAEDIGTWMAFPAI